jgi:hypothetical protein
MAKKDKKKVKTNASSSSKYVCSDDDEPLLVKFAKILMLCDDTINICPGQGPSSCDDL